MISDRIQKLEGELRELLAKYEDLGALILIEDGTDEKLMSGTMCPVCALEYIASAVATNGIKHHSLENKPEPIIEHFTPVNKVH